MCVCVYVFFSFLIFYIDITRDQEAKLTLLTNQKNLLMQSADDAHNKLEAQRESLLQLNFEQKKLKVNFSLLDSMTHTHTQKKDQ